MLPGTEEHYMTRVSKRRNYYGEVDAEGRKSGFGIEQTDEPHYGLVTYIGEFAEDHRSGIGILLYGNSFSHQGHWKESKMNGWAKIKYGVNTHEVFEG